MELGIGQILCRAGYEHEYRVVNYIIVQNNNETHGSSSAVGILHGRCLLGPTGTILHAKKVHAIHEHAAGKALWSTVDNAIKQLLLSRDAERDIW